jgi:hypothetical protein
MLAEQETTEVLRLLRLICERTGINPGECANGRAFEEDTQHAEIVKQIQGEIEDRGVYTEPNGTQSG